MSPFSAVRRYATGCLLRKSLNMICLQPVDGTAQHVTSQTAQKRTSDHMVTIVFEHVVEEV